MADLLRLLLLHGRSRLYMYQLHHMRSTSQTSLPLMHPAQTHQPQSFFSTSIGLQPHTMLMCVVQNGSG